MNTPTKTYRVEYRFVPDTDPRMSVTLHYAVDSHSYLGAEMVARKLFEQEVEDRFGFYSEDWIRRVTITN